VALVCSSGGHLAHLLVLRPWWEDRDRFWVTFDKEDARDTLAGERRYWCHFPTNRNAWNLLRNLIIAVRVCLRERPTLIVSSGAAIAVPFFYVSKLLLRSRTVYVEVVDRVDHPTLSGRLVRPVTDRYLVQWPEQEPHYPSARVIGRLM
jgi:beta-1,4-N-acetylglucosaminyltransferase